MGSYYLKRGVRKMGGSREPPEPPGYGPAHYDVFQARPPWQDIVKFNKGIILVITETRFAIQSQVT